MTAHAALPLALDVVSVQSQVVYGRVGNNVAIPTLEALGLSTAAVPTVVFSNTPHYPTMHGGALPEEWFEGYLNDLSARDALRTLRAVLSGYLGNPEQAQSVARWIRTLPGEPSGLRIVVDPVLGDQDCGLYVDPSMVDAYRSELLPLADGLTPNGFELAQLTGMPTNDVNAVVVAARSLLTARTRWVAVTSAAPASCTDDQMQVILVTRTQVEVITHPRIDIAPKGTGDLFCAGLTGNLLNGTDLLLATQRACELVMQALHLTRMAHSAELLLPCHAASDNARRAICATR